MTVVRFLGLTFLFYACTGVEEPPPDEAITPHPKPSKVFRLAFGSCNKHDHPQPMWRIILRYQPDLFLWLGDIVYADTRNMELMRKKYDIQKAKPWYKRLLAQTRVIGIWDDHDYGENNSGKAYPLKEESQQILLDFLDEPPDSPRRKQEGVYVAYSIPLDSLRLLLILPDERYFRDDPGVENDILGEAQWKWLDSLLRYVPADITLIGSSTQLLPYEHDAEKWADYPRARKRFLDLLHDTRRSGVVILSGDRHWGEISCMKDSPTGYPLYEITSSGMTHYKPWLAYTFRKTKNSYRLGEVYRGLNFGLMEIDYSSHPVQITMMIIDQWDQIRLKVPVGLDSLQFREKSHFISS